MGGYHWYDLNAGGQLAAGDAVADDVRPALNPRQFGARCDGGLSETGHITAGANTVLDNVPPPVLPLAGQKVTFMDAGPATEVGGGITGVTIAAAGVVTTATAHHLKNGQNVTIAGVLGAPTANGTFAATVLSPTTFSIPVAVAGTYTSGGAVSVPSPLIGYVATPRVTGSSLTFAVVDADGAPVNAAFTFLSGGVYYFGTDDLAAWTALSAAVQALPGAGTTTVFWTGISMVSGTVVFDHAVELVGDAMDYTNPDGVASGSQLPRRGSILRAHGDFANATTSAVLQLGGSVGGLGGKVSTSIRGGCVDGIGVTQSAIRTLGLRDTLDRVYALNGVERGIDVQSSSVIGTFCCIGMQNRGDGLFFYGSADSKWSGGFIRQAANPIHIAKNFSDLYIGDGLHIFNGYNGGNEQAGNDILVEVDANSTGNAMLVLNGVVFDGVLGSHVRIAPGAGGSISAVSIVGCSFFQPTATGIPDGAYSLVEIDTTAAGAKVGGVVLSGFIARAAGPTSRYSSIVKLIGSGASRVSLGLGDAGYCKGFFDLLSGAARSHITGLEAVSLFDGTNSRQSSNASKYFNTTAGAGATSITIPHNLGAMPNTVALTKGNATTPDYYATVDAANITVNFAALAAITSISWYWRVSL